MTEAQRIERNELPQMEITLTGDIALAMEYAAKLIRFQHPEFDGMTDEEIISVLVNIGLNSGEVFA